MKKKVLLAIIPALMVLSSCTFMESATIVKGNEFLEDTLAHEEIFGDVNFEARALQPKRLNDDPVEHPEAENFAIGVQSQVETANHISFRFVAAVRFATGQLNPTEAKWTRTVTAKDGTVQKAKSQLPCAKAYKKISNGGGAYTIDNYNSAHELTGDDQFTHFVVYTLRNVPVEVATDYYVSAYLHLTTKEGSEGGKELTSKAVVVNASESEKFAYVPDQGKYYITGSFTGDKIQPTAVRSGGNIAEFESGLNLEAGDKFVINEFYDSEYIVHGASQLVGGKSNYYFENDNGDIKAKYNGDYKIYFKYEDDTNKIFAEGDNVVRPVYIKLADSASAWNQSNQIVIYAFGTAGNHWYATEKITGGFKTLLPIDPADYQTIKIVEITSGKELDWANKVEDHETDNLSYPTAPGFEGDNVQNTIFGWHRTYYDNVNYWGSSWGAF